MQDTPCKAGTPLGHVDPVPFELAGIIYTWIKAETGIKLLWGRKQVKGAHFSNQDNCTQETGSPEGLDEADLVIGRLALQSIHSLMEFFGYGIKMLLVLTVGFYIQPDPDGIAWKRASENSGIFCSSAYGIIFGKGIFFAKTCSFPNDFDKVFLRCGKHVCSKGYISGSLRETCVVILLNTCRYAGNDTLSSAFSFRTTADCRSLK